MFPEQRPRRLRKSAAMRSLVRETTLTADDLIYPIFVIEGKSRKEPIPSMPGQFRYSPDKLPGLICELQEIGAQAVILFGIPAKKDRYGTGSHKKDGAVQQAIRLIKDCAPEIIVISDICLCEYTDHGHCGILDGDGNVSNDDTLEVLAKVALSHAKAGCDIVAPSDMMDGRVGIIREALDEGGYEELPILSYSAKYASAFYGPFRDAAECAPSFGDRKSYQMDPANLREAIREAQLDVEEGADMLMVKPAGAYLDVIRTLAEEFNEPLCAYQVSGEYAMIKAAAMNGWLDEDAAIMESLIAIKRAGADMIISYFTPQALRLLK